METTRLSTKGQIVLPLSIRTSHAWGPGTEFTVEETRDGILLRPAATVPTTTLDQVVGSGGYKGKRISIAQMNQAIEKEVKRRHGLGRY